MSARFDGKSVLVTGAASGIGKATVDLFADEGANVIAVDLNITARPGPVRVDSIVTVLGNAGDEREVAAMVATAVERHGGLDIICANAGISGGMAGLFEQSAEDWQSLLQVNLIGPFLAIKHGAKAMIDAGRPGAIVCTASVAGLRAGAGGLAYSASKAGVINLVQGAAQQLTGSGIRVNAVCPGLVDTGMTQDLYAVARSKGREDLIGQLNPLKRGGEPVEIARTIAFLASDEAAYINGQALVVDGGLSTSLPFAKPRKLGQASF
ncbi:MULTISPECIES: SDR family NAD(P)-dependent oxidoreductase [unclassified Sphingomonas]|uniref:SDR family NAD(P)-dependent oxidoreductase n=1 Tax=unclassified Sphingomonas TaxID=196159 RepID=UPI0006F2A256|nr:MULTISPECIES: SDR family NAD(P)-dependent oxidoreductase [unclassified Sphingomonas]KQX18567.1 oxidoreductase [Sphingomonas sp. Root1294]KQY72109.1 oxidoreductase [Sphingomonas sp. Root50]KRB94621.1 oxidoreductase [Sphingomonas sp. Root720]